MLQKPNEKNRDLIVNINGKLVHSDQAGVSPFDSVVQGGDAVWEGLRLYDGRIFKLTYPDTAAMVFEISARNSESVIGVAAGALLLSIKNAL